MSNNQNFNYLDPFLPFISNFESPTTTVEQDPWVNAGFGFEGDFNFANSNLLDNFGVSINNSQVPSPFFNNNFDFLNQKMPVSTDLKEAAATEKPKVKKATKSQKAVTENKIETAVPSTGNEELDHILDKRRRNTLASARFRVRKKQKEQELERTSKELAEKVETLEKKIDDLEKENKWLRSLLLEKSGR